MSERRLERVLDRGAAYSVNLLIIATCTAVAVAAVRWGFGL